jgi:hypothetical protein
MLFRNTEGQKASLCLWFVTLEWRQAKEHLNVSREPLVKLQEGSSPVGVQNHPPSTSLALHHQHDHFVIWPGWPPLPVTRHRLPSLSLTSTSSDLPSVARCLVPSRHTSCLHSCFSLHRPQRILIVYLYFNIGDTTRNRLLWPCCLRRGSAASPLLGSRVRILLREWMFVCCVCSMLYR